MTYILLSALGVVIVSISVIHLITTVHIRRAIATAQMMRDIQSLEEKLRDERL